MKVFGIIKYAFIVGILCLLIASPVRAATYQDVTVTATPKWTEGISNFTITYVSENQIDITWGYGSGTSNIMIRGKWGEYPDDIPNEDTEPSDGFLIYSGSGTNTSYFFDDNITTLYIKAWGQKDTGKWHTNTDTGFEEGAMILFGLIILSLGLSYIGARSSYWVLKFVAGLSWWGVGAYWLNGGRPASMTAGTTADIIIIILCLFAGLAMMMMPFWFEKSESGRTIGKLRLPFTPEDEEPKPNAPTMRERNRAYRQRVNGRLGLNR